MEENAATEPNANTLDDGEAIECPVAMWYYKRMGLMFLMLFAMGCWFLYDATVGYPNKKAIWDQYTAMTGYDLKLVSDMSGLEDLPNSGKLLVIVGKREGGYHIRVFDGKAEQSVNADTSAESVKKAYIEKLNEALDGKWDQPELAADEEQEILRAVGQVVSVNVKGAQKTSERMDEWRELAKEKGWELEPEEYTSSKIATQWQFTIGMFVASLVVIVIFLLNKRKVLRADAEAFYTSSGIRVAFGDVFRIDRRKWDHKGLAYAMYRRGGEGSAKKATIDDLKFLGAEKILKRMLNNFEGELIDRIRDEDDEPDENSEKMAESADSEEVISADSADGEASPKAPKS